MLMVQGGQTPAISPAGQADNGESLVAVECKSSLHTSRRARSIAPWSRQSIALTQIQFSPGAPPPITYLPSVSPFIPHPGQYFANLGEEFCFHS